MALYNRKSKRIPSLGEAITVPSRAHLHTSARQSNPDSQSWELGLVRLPSTIKPTSEIIMPKLKTLVMFHYRLLTLTNSQQLIALDSISTTLHNDSYVTNSYVNLLCKCTRPDTSYSFTCLTFDGLISLMFCWGLSTVNWAICVCCIMQFERDELGKGYQPRMVRGRHKSPVTLCDLRV